MRWPEESRQAARRLVEGNRQFVSEFEASVAADDRSRILSTADPFAVVLGCSDSRVPPELVLDQDVGDLFVVRVVGTVAASPAVASIEYAVAHWGCPLVLVLGHTQCAAVGAAMDPPPSGPSAPDLAGLPHLASLLVEIRSNIAGARQPAGSGAAGAADSAGSEAGRWQTAVEANTRRSAESLRLRSSLLNRRIAEGALAVVPAVYAVETGLLRLLDTADGDLAGETPIVSANPP